MQTIINSVADLNLQEKDIVAKGSCSTIYRYNEDEYLKILNDEYYSLAARENQEVLKTLEALSEITDTPSIATPRNIFKSENELYGYTSTIMPGVSLDEIPQDTRIEVLKNALNRIKKEVRTLSQHHIKTEDIGGDNILFSDHIALIDLELSLVDEETEEDILYRRTMRSILNSVITNSFGTNVTGKIPSLAMRRLNEDLKAGVSDNYANYYALAIYEIEHMANTKIATVGDSRKAYQKVKSKYKM